MKIRYPHFYNTEEITKIYEEYDRLTPVGRHKAAYETDTSSGEYMFDRILSRHGEAHGNPNCGGNNDNNALMTRGRALYMYTHDASVIGFGGRPSYCQPFSADHLFTLKIYSDHEIKEKALEFAENKDARINMPSSYHAEFSCGTSGLSLKLDKFFTEQNCAVLLASLTNTGNEPLTLRTCLFSPFTDTPWYIYPNNKIQGELRGRIPEADGLTVLSAHLTGTGFSVSAREKTDERFIFPHPDADDLRRCDTAVTEHLDELEISDRLIYTQGDGMPLLSRTLELDAGATEYINGVFSFTSDEIPDAEREYMRYAALSADSETALSTAKREYNEFWHKTIPYIDVPDAAVRKAIDYRFWLERYNVLDADIPGYDYRYPVTIEGVLGYNNAIALTQCMHLEDTKWRRTPSLSYGQLLSVGASSGGSAFVDNPGNRRNWNNHYGQYIADAGKNTFFVHGGGKELAGRLAYWFECDCKGQLEHYGNHTSGSTPPQKLISYQSNCMTGTDADTISMHYRGVGRFKTHAENAYVFGAAKASAEMYAVAENKEKSAELDALAEDIRSDILKYLWCDKCLTFETRSVAPESDFVIHNENKPNLVPLKESNSYNYFYMGVPPVTDEYREAFRFLADDEEFPVFPYYTASQRDNKTLPGSNNFSNINFTVQAHAYEAALRRYDREHKYVTPEMLASMTEWCAWNVYPDGGDVRYPNNSEFFNADKASDPSGKGDYYRSWIYHNILGNYVYIFIEDMAGLRPRADGIIELDPIDFGYGHFTADNMRYHGRDVSVIYNHDGKYESLPKGYSLFIDGSLAFTVDSLKRVIFDPESGHIESEAGVLYAVPSGKLPSAAGTEIDDERTLALMRAAGFEKFKNLAPGAKVEASYSPSAARTAPWNETHRADGGDASSLAVNEPLPLPEYVTDGIFDSMPFWGNDGSKNEFDTLTLTLPFPKTFDTLTAYFYDDRRDGGYSYPRRYLIEYLDGGEWKSVTTRSQAPRYMCAGKNTSYFDAVTTDKVKISFYNRRGHFTAVTEIGLYYEGTPRRAVMNHAP